MSDEKSALREELIARRRAVGAEGRAELEATLADWVRAAVGERAAAFDAMALYAAKDFEARVDSLEGIGSPGALIAYPRVAGPAELAFHQVSSRDDLIAGPFGLLEPPADAPLVVPGGLRLIIVPGLGFDHFGGRLGWGRGYYDAALPLHPDAIRIAVAFSTQLIDRVPTDPWDTRVDFIITEEGLIECKPCS